MCVCVCACARAYVGEGIRVLACVRMCLCECTGAGVCLRACSRADPVCMGVKNWAMELKEELHKTGLVLVWRK